MTSFRPTPYVAFTTPQDWNAEPETSTKVPKTLADQVASTKVGRAMQEHAGNVRDQVEDLTQNDYQMVESSDRRTVASYFESGKITIASNGSFEVDPETDKATLADMKEALLDLTLSPENRQEMVKLIAKVDEAIANQEVTEAPQVVVRALEEMQNLQNQVRQAVQKRQFDALPHINVSLIAQALELLDGFEKMRSSNPDKMIDLLDELHSSNGPVNPYKSALINFVATHNSFGFSEEVESGLTYRANKDATYQHRRGGKASFTQALVNAYSAPKAKDDPRRFLQQTTRIPEARFEQTVKSILG